MSCTELSRASLGPGRCCRRKGVLLFIALAIAFGMAVPSFAGDEEAPSEDETASEYHSSLCQTPGNPRKLFFECVGIHFDVIRETLTKDLDGYRSWLARQGITAIHSYTAQFMVNPTGGKSQGFTYAGTLQDLVSWDLHKFAGIPGLSFTVGATYASGRDLSAKYIGNVFKVQGDFNGKGNVNLQEMYLQQQISDGALTIGLGRLAPANLFANMPVLDNYVNGGIDSFPASLNINDPAFVAGPPGVEWGAQAIYHLTPTIQVAAGVYNTNPHAAAGEDNGINFAFQQGNKGVLTIAEVTYLYNEAQGDAGMPGEYSLGGSYDSNTFMSLSNSAGTESGSYSLYALFQQMVYRDGGPGSQKGLTVWGEATISPKPGVSSMPYFVGGGSSYKGIIPSREKDTASIGVIYGSFSRHIPQTSGETAIEANYNIAVTPWLSIMPDVQCILKPGGSDIHTAVAIGAQLAIVF
jgi:porin